MPLARRMTKGRTQVAAVEFRRLIAAWEQRDSANWDAAAYREAGQRTLELGHPTFAYEILRQGHALHPGKHDLTYLTALAATRCGSYREAEALLGALVPRLRRKDPLYAEAKSLEGRIAKDLWARLPDGIGRRAAGERAAAAYVAAHAASGDLFPAINAATLKALLGDRESSQALASTVQHLCLQRLRDGKRADHWLYATLGEACLLLGESEQAGAWYRRAARKARGRAGDVASMRRQLRLMSGCLAVPAEVQAALAAPQVLVFTGHMLDRPGRAQERFPARLEAQVTRAIAAELDAADAGIGYSSAACGADIIFIEQMLKRGAEVNVILPFAEPDFLETSVAFAGSAWVRRFRRALARATRVSRALHERYLGDDILFGYTATLTQGAALLRGQHLETGVLQLALLDAGDAELTGGTLSAVSTWEGHGLPSRRIDLAALRGSRSSPAPCPEPPAARREVKTMLFADMVGFSKLQESDTPAFLVHFLGEIARVVSSSGVKPAFLNTWGDGLFMVFDEVTGAAEFALKLRDAVLKTDWPAHGLPTGTSIRIGMHAGPVFPAVDPIIGRRNFFGAHVNRAARIEPVTAPGAVYISEQMAALLAASGTRQFACDYLGAMELAKHYGESVLYRLRRTHEGE